MLLLMYWLDSQSIRPEPAGEKSRPWFLFGAVPFAVAALLAFSVPDISPDGKLVYAYVTYIFLSFMYTVVNIPLASILPTLTDDMNERTVLATWRKFFAFMGSTIVSATALYSGKK